MRLIFKLRLTTFRFGLLIGNFQSLRPSVFLGLGQAAPNRSFMLGGVRLPDVSKITDLGVMVDNKLKFDLHIHGIVQKAHIKAQMIRRCFITHDRCVLLQAFTTYVRPALEYSTCLWSPTYAGLVDEIEAVQRRFTKRLGG